MPQVLFSFAGYQFLESDNTSPNVDEALEARIKDPLWFLVRQWQTGEFEAENGGRVAQMDVGYTTFPMDGFTPGNEGEQQALSPQTPLDYVLEAEESDGSSQSWRSEALEFAATVHAGEIAAECKEYHGSDLDWYHFDLKNMPAENANGETLSMRIVPTGLAYQNMPHPRWWRFEENDAIVYLTDDEEPNVLSMLLPEFLNADANNWFIAPVEQPVGHFRHMEHVRIVDSFGVMKEIEPIAALQNGSWEVFSLDGAEDANGVTGPSMGADVLFAPNVGTTVLNGEVFEEINFIRDEDANCVWAVERYYFDPDTEQPINRDDEVSLQASATEETEVASTREETVIPKYKLRAPLRENWIPYIPKRIKTTPRNAEQTYYRRARTAEAATADDPQYKTQILGESWKILEEEVPRVGLKVQRLKRFVRGSDGTGWFWTGRRKRIGAHERSANVRYDYLDDES